MNGLRKRSASGDRGVFGALLACALILAASALAAQQPTPPPSAPDAKPAPADAQQPGAGAQLRTGTASGLDADARLQNLLADHQFLRIQAQLDQLQPDQAQYYRGILANRSNDLKASIDLLEPLIDRVTAAGDATQEKLLRKALAEDYLRLGDWVKAAKAYQALDTRLQGKLSADERDEIEMPLKMLPLAAANPSMTVDPCDPFQLQVSKNPLGLTDIPVFVDASPHTWMLDPTAPFNLISRSVAKNVGLKVSDETVTIHTLTGRPMQVYVTVIPRFTVGGRLTLRNMTAFVFEDGDYFYPKSHYQVEGVLGYPALSALGSLTITSHATIEVRPAKQISPAEKDDQLTNGARFFLDGDQVIVALGNAKIANEPPPQPELKPEPAGEVALPKEPKPAGFAEPAPAPDPKLTATADASTPQETKPGEERMYAVDAAGQQSYLTSRYYDEHSADFANQKMELFSIPGSLALPPQPAYIAENVALAVGAATVRVHYVQVLTQPIGSAALDDVYGVLGVDVLDQLKAYTFDYRTMRFGVRPE